MKKFILGLALGASLGAAVSVSLVSSADDLTLEKARRFDMIADMMEQRSKRMGALRADLQALADDINARYGHVCEVVD